MIISKFPSPTVEKANGFIKLSTNAIILPPSGSETFTFTKIGTGTATVLSSDESVCIASLSGNTVTVTTVGEGMSNVIVNVTEGSANKATSAVCTCINADSILANNDPDIIKQIADSGVASLIWNVGDCTAPIIISESADLPNFTPPSYDICAFIIGFNHNLEIEGTGIHFQLCKNNTGKDIALCDNGCGSTQTSGTWFNMKNTSSSVGGWESSRMRTVICPAFFLTLPQEWQNVISTTVKYTDNNGNDANEENCVTSTSDELFLLSEYEVFGTTRYSNSFEAYYQKRYEYYANGNSAQKYKSTSIGETNYWWLRSPRGNVEGSYTFCVAATTSELSYHVYANYSNGFAPGFKIGGESV